MKYDHYDFWNKPVYNPITGYRVPPLNDYFKEKSEVKPYVREPNRLPESEDRDSTTGTK